MSEADEALLWARGDWARGLKSKSTKNDVRQGLWDECLDDLAHGYRAGAAASAERIKELRRILINTAANLRGAISLLENGGKKAAPSNKVFEIMVSDYRAESGRANDILARAERAYHAAYSVAVLLKEPDQ